MSFRNTGVLSWQQATPAGEFTMHKGMKNMTEYNKKPGVILCLLLAGLLNACASLNSYTEAPRVSLASIEPKDMTLLEQRYGIRLRIMNPNDAVLPVAGLSYAIEINEREFAYGGQPAIGGYSRIWRGVAGCRGGQQPAECDTAVATDER